MKVFIASVDIFSVRILANSLREAMDIFMEESIEFPTVEIDGKIYVRLGTPGEMSKDFDGNIEVTFTEDLDVVINEKFK